MTVLTVHMLNDYVRGLLSCDPILRDIRVRGEISNYKNHPSGHIYFTLKDDSDRIRCVFFRQNNHNLNFIPRDGQRVIARGAVSIYGRDGQYQLYVDTMERDGVGDLYLAFEALKEKLKNEGLFEKEFKKPLPYFPRRIAVITSHTGAAVRDIIRVVQRRNPCVDVLVVPVAVQGPEAHNQICRAIDYVNTRDDIDLVIIGRGGGSIEELWAFNEEDVARAIFRSHLPVISGVGHETDFTIADFVADVRAATPTAAGELAVPELARLKSDAARLCRALNKAAQNMLSGKHRALDRLKSHYIFKAPQMLLLQHSQYVDQLSQRLGSSFGNLIAIKREAMARSAARLNALSPLGVLGRGYALPLHKDTNITIGSVLNLKPHDKIRLVFRDGQADCTVDSINASD